MTTEEALLAAVLANPADDLRRLVLADHYEGELGQTDRAEFIRVQVDISHIRLVTFESEHGIVQRPLRLNDSSRWSELCHRERYLFEAAESGGWFAGLGLTRVGLGEPSHDIGRYGIVRRGFISEVRCTLGEWCGGECHQCAGTGRSFPLGSPSIPCRRCGGSLVTGIGPQIVRRHPVTRVVLTDRRPDRSSWSTPSSSGEVFDWYRAGSALDTSDPSVLPNDFFLSCEMQLERTHKTREDAFEALSIAAIDWAKSQPTHATDSTVEMTASHP